MEIYKIKNLDCSLPENRQKLLKVTKKVIKSEEKPTKKKLYSICKSLMKKYKIKIKKFRQENGLLFVSLEIEPGTYSTFYCYTFYEMMCKYILYVKAIQDYRKAEIK